MLDPTLLLRNLNPVFCEIFAASPYIFVQLSSWIVVSLTIEQTIAVCRPFNSIFKSSWVRWRQYGIVLVITLTSFLDNIPVFTGFCWGHEEGTLLVEDHSNKTSTSPATVPSAGPATAPIDSSDACVGAIDSPAHLFIVQLGLMAIIPIVTLLLCNVIIITKLITQNKKLKKLAAQRKANRTDSLIASMTARTIAISIVQCVTGIPVVSMDIFFLAHPEAEEDSQTWLIYDICNTMYYLNNAINVIFYCLLGRSFRQDCADFFSRKPKYAMGRTSNSLETGPTRENSTGTAVTSVEVSSSVDSITDKDCRAIINERF